MKSTLFLTLLACYTLVNAQTSLNLNNENSSLTVDGTSNVHDWTLNAEKMSGKTELEKDNARVKSIKSLNLIVTVLNLTSERSGLAKNAYKAMNSDQYPVVSYTMTKVHSINPSKDGKGYVVTADGKLTIAGITNEEKLKVYSLVLPDGTVSFKGEITFAPTKYKIEPVKALMGSIKTADEVTVKFNIFYK